MRVVANAGPIIHLSRIDQLELLRALFDEVVVPAAVEQEVLRPGSDWPGVDSIRRAFADGWMIVRSVERASLAGAFATDLDPGESEAISLYGELDADLILIDERRARAYGQELGIRLTGTLGILTRARDRGLIGAVAPVLDSLRARGFRITDELVERLRAEESTG